MQRQLVLKQGSFRLCCINAKRYSLFSPFLSPCWACFAKGGLCQNGYVHDVNHSCRLRWYVVLRTYNRSALHDAAAETVKVSANAVSMTDSRSCLQQNSTSTRSSQHLQVRVKYPKHPKQKPQQGGTSASSSWIIYKPQQRECLQCLLYASFLASAAALNSVPPAQRNESCASILFVLA